MSQNPYPYQSIGRYRGLIYLLTAFSLSLCLGLAALEGLCHVLRIPYNGIKKSNEAAAAVFDPELGWAYKPGDEMRNRYGLTGKTVYYFIDSHGVRVPAPDFETDGTRPSMIFIGDSFTFGHGLLYEETIPGAFLNYPNLPYQLVNLGVQGYGSDQALLALKRHLKWLTAPRVVVYTYADFQIVRNGIYDSRLTAPLHRFPGTKPLLGYSRGKGLYLKKRPLPYDRYHPSRLLDLLYMRLGKLFGFFPPEKIELTRQIILEMKKTAEASGAKFYVLYWRWSKDEGPSEVLKGLDVPVIDVLERAPDNWSGLRIPGDGHPDERADAHAAEIVAFHLIEDGLLPPPMEKPASR